MKTKSVEINGCTYEFIKEVPSETSVRASVVRIDGKYYTVLCAFIPRLTHEISAYPSTKTGRPENLCKPLFKFFGTDLQVGIDKLINTLADAKTGA